MRRLVEIMKAQNIVTDDNTIITKEHILAAPADLRRAALSNLTYQLGKKFKDMLPEYKATNDPELCAEWLPNFIAKPESGGGASNTMHHEVKRERQKETSTMKLWLAKDQLAGPSFMDSVDHAEFIATDAKGTDNERP